MIEIRRRNRAVLLTSLVAVLTPATSDAGWRLWPSPYDGAETIDQYQTAGDPKGSRAWVAPGKAIGQTFVPRRTPLVRMDFETSNTQDRRPGALKLWRWQGSYERTVAEKPLFEDVVEMSGDVGFGLRSFFPRIEVQVGATYFVEFSAAGRGPYTLRAARDGLDHYPDGRLRLSSGFAPKAAAWDLWFRTYSSPEGPPEGVPWRSSDSAQPWTEPTRTPSEVTRRDYFDRIAAYAEYVRNHHLNACVQELGGSALLEAFLYKASCEAGECDERYARNLRRIFRNAHAWRFCGPRPERARPCEPACNPDPQVGFNWLERPGIAYLWARHSPTLTPEDHALIRELLLDSARRFWPRREPGAHNRSMWGAVGYLLVATLFPDEPEAATWRDYAAGVWEEFWSARDTTEDSASYNAAWWALILEYAAIAGLDEEMWNDPGFRSLVERFFECTAPMGAILSHGDGAGWNRGISQMIWLFEKAGAHYREPRYRWLAHRLFDYVRSNARDDPPRSDSLYKDLTYLAWAYLDADETLERRAPTAQREVRAAEQTTAGAWSWQVPSGQSIGQTFVATTSPLVRIDLRARNEGDERPATLSLWEWRGSHEATIAGTPLYRDTLELRGEDALALRSLHPFLEVKAGARYYVELVRDGAPFSLAGSQPGEAAYADGALYARGEAEEETDLWFRTFTLSEGGSAYTIRRRTVPVPRNEWEERVWLWRAYAYTDSRVPDKLVLRSGFRPDDLHALVNLVRGYAHGQEELGALVSLLDGGSVILADTPFPYWFHQNLPEDEAIPLLRRYWGGDYGAPDEHATVTRFADSRNATVAWLEWDDPRGWRVRQERRLYFVKNRFLLVRDRFSFPERMAVAVGPVWHAADLHPSRGEHWCDVYYREPLANVWKYRNPERYALLYFVPRPGQRFGAFEEASYLPPEDCPRNAHSDTVDARCRSGPPFVVYQRWTGETSPGESRWFDTLLLPHGPELSPADAAGRVRVLFSDSERVALEVSVGDETWTFVDQPQGGVIEVPGLAADARYAIVRSAPDRPPYLLTHAASRVEVGNLSHRWPVRTSVELGGYTPPDRPRQGAGPSREDGR